MGMQNGGQEISLGEGCDRKEIIEHEILHALGFFHEQSRRDRDSHININWENIKAGNFAFSAITICTCMWKSYLAGVDPGIYFGRR